MNSLHEGKEILKGEALRKRMEALERLVREETQKASAAKAKQDKYNSQAADAGAARLEHARNAGEWLDEAKWRMGHRTKWTRWKKQVMKELDLKPRTIRQYSFIARHWKDPIIEEARAKGIVIDSIKKFLTIYRSGPPTTPENLDSTLKERNKSTADIRKVFAEYLRSLDSYEVEILYATLDDVLAVANADLKERVCGAYEGPYYLHREEAWKDVKAISGETKSVAAQAIADLKEIKLEKWNSLPVQGNKEAHPPDPRRRKRRRRDGK